MASKLDGARPRADIATDNLGKSTLTRVFASRTWSVTTGQVLFERSCFTGSATSVQSVATKPGDWRLE